MVAFSQDEEYLAKGKERNVERVDTRAGGLGLGPPGARITYKDEHETKWEPYVDAAKNSLARATLKLEPLHREDLLAVSFCPCSSKVFFFFWRRRAGEGRWLIFPLLSFDKRVSSRISKYRKKD